MRRIASPGRYPMSWLLAWATVIGRALMVLGWSTTTSPDPWVDKRSKTARSFASSFGNAL
jgi:hypothetical protein